MTRIADSRPIALTGTWFGRVGLAPYTLLGMFEGPAEVIPLVTLPRLDLAA